MSDEPRLRPIAAPDYFRILLLIEAFHLHALGHYEDDPLWRVLEEVHDTRAHELGLGQQFDQDVPVLGEALLAGELNHARRVLERLALHAKGVYPDLSIPERPPERFTVCSTPGCPNLVLWDKCMYCELGLGPANAG